MIALMSLALAGAPKWTATVDPLTFTLGFAHVQVERAVGNRFSVYAGPSFKLFDAPWGEQEPYRGFGLEVGVRFFFLPKSGDAPEGAWVMARGVAARLNTTDGSNVVSLGGYGSVLGGYTWIVGDRLVLAAGLGVQRLQYTVSDFGIEGWLPAAHTNIGVAF